MEIYDKRGKGYIEVWLTNKEQEMYDRRELTDMLLLHYKASKKCRVVFFLSGNGDLFQCTENLLIKNLGCV